jgi:hypothetical protein
MFQEKQTCGYSVAGIFKKIILAIQQDHRRMKSFELKKHESP